MDKKLKTVYWRDAVYVENEDLEVIKHKKLPLVATHGMIVHQDDDKIIVCVHMTCGEKDDILTSGDDFMMIPTKWIDRIE